MENSINVKDSRIYGFLVLYDMHTDFFKRAIVNITDAAAVSRLDSQANHMAWLTGSLVQQRFELANRFGNEMQQTAHELFSDGKGINDSFDYPSLSDFQTDWERVSPILRTILVGLDSKQLDAVFEDMGMKMSYFDFLSFIIYREANIIGQLALWRRLLGYPALKYE